MAYELLIFDCDGVLVDTERLTNRVFAKLLCEEGLLITPEQTMERFLGRTMASCLEEIAAELGRPVREDFVDLYHEGIFEVFDRELERVPGIDEALDALSERPMCVASSGSHRKMERTLGKTGLLPRFEGRLFSGTEVANGKPAPDLFLYAAERMGVAPGRCLVVEDSPRGALGAHRAGMAVLGFARDTQPEKLEDCGAIPFRSMSELPERIAELDRAQENRDGG